MDIQNSNSQRRRLTKKPPPHHLARTSSGFDGGLGFDAQSLHSKRSTHSLKRSPSAPHARANYHYPNASNNSSPRHPPSILRSNPSPLLGAAEFPTSSSNFNHQNLPIAAAATAAAPQHRARRLSDPQSQHLQPLNHNGGDDLIGAPFDGAAILNRLDAPRLPSPSTKPIQPPPLIKANTDTGVMNPSAPQPGTFMPTDHHSVNEKTSDTKVMESPVTGPKRASDEAKEPRLGVLRKKSGFSGFVSGLVGSPKKPVISAPENPVHVTHVGYDSNTGQFTVRITVSFPIVATVRTSIAKICFPGPATESLSLDAHFALIRQYH